LVRNRKLIEVSIPLGAINEQSAREKSIRHGHPATLHLWWARRPLATARAVLFSQLVDDPSVRAEDYREEARVHGYDDVDGWIQHRIKQERAHLFDLITRMVNWDNINDEGLFEEVRATVLKSTGGAPPVIFDPFAGGGTIPLEAQRLGLESHASDLNPVAVLINKALIEIPPKFSNLAPVFPGADLLRTDWTKATGLAEDVRRYGQWMRDEAEARIGHLYPKVVLGDGTMANPIAWIWARTVICPNPACGIEMPLVRSWWLGKKKGKESYLVPSVVDGKVHFSIGHEISGAPAAGTDGTVGRTGATCVSCGTSVPLTYIREQGRSVGLGRTLLATVAEGHRRRIYLPADDLQRDAANVAGPPGVPIADLAKNPRNFQTPNYGLSTIASLFTNRQLVALTTFSDLVAEARERVLADALASGLEVGARLDAGGTGAAGYADAIATYLGMGVSKIADMSNSLASWKPSMDQAIALFRRQAIPMVWDYAETPPLGYSAGGLVTSLRGMAKVLEQLPAVGRSTAAQANAATVNYSNMVISTDPPYYDNIGYSDLSDFFYVWLRRSLRDIHPSLLTTLLVPKAEELVANPYRHGGAAGAKKFFEDGFEHVFEQARDSATESYPMTVYYAFKQTESDVTGTASTGWETILGSMIRAGWTITATWPMRSELGNRMIASGANALASSVVLALRPRETGAPTTDRRGFIAAMKREIGPALRELQQGGIAPVDLPQAAIGPGMSVFSRYSSVIESDGSPMPVRAALAHINEMLDEVLTEQEGDFDAITRFALAWYRGHGYESAPYGDAEDLARARGTAVSTMERSGILTARAGRVGLYRPSDLASDYDVLADSQTSAWEALHHAIRVLEMSGITAAGLFLQTASQRADGAVDLDLVKELAYLVFQVAEKNGWSKDAQSFNDIATSWGDLLQAERLVASVSTSVTLDFEEDE
jgi:putative DNA methylase